MSTNIPMLGSIEYQPVAEHRIDIQPVDDYTQLPSTVISQQSHPALGPFPFQPTPNTDYTPEEVIHGPTHIGSPILAPPVGLPDLTTNQSHSSSSGEGYSDTIVNTPEDRRSRSVRSASPTPSPESDTPPVDSLEKGKGADRHEADFSYADTLKVSSNTVHSR